ncbi:hypothetical protein Acor_15560 [Acrocarpospora corrugata]|uniref:Uncharacterized protein n=1 Tax=Acrocarpospora corrugata TaxID=35763 RepID=A0A5M3VWL8_9ACTN|nr:hypothetical protein Acor_15560 [Acrocarpospora corrugata]
MAATTKRFTRIPSLGRKFEAPGSHADNNGRDRTFREMNGVGRVTTRSRTVNRTGVLHAEASKFNGESEAGRKPGTPDVLFYHSNSDKPHKFLRSHLMSGFIRMKVVT